MNQSPRLASPAKGRLRFVAMVLAVFACWETGMGQSIQTITPDFFNDNPVVLDASKANKVARLIRDGETKIVLEGSEELRSTHSENGMSFVRYQTRQTPGGSVSTDTVEFTASHLAPVSRKSIFRGDTLYVSFTPTGVKGDRRGESGIADLSADFARPFFDSNILDHLCTVLARIGPGSYVVPLYLDRTNTVEDYAVEVFAPAPVEFAEEGQHASKVVYRNPEGREGIVWIDIASGRILREEAHPMPGVDYVMDWVYE